MREAAEDGRNLIVVTDDAYFGLFYGENVLQESLFASLAGCHERILAVKVDGPTKEEFVWGFRTGMLTFSSRRVFSDDTLYNALGEESRRGDPQRDFQLLSGCAVGVGEGLAGEAIAAERLEKKDILEARAKRVQEILSAPEYAEFWEPYPFNAGYFMCLKLKGLDAETYRKHLLEKYGVGVIADGDRDIRIAFSSVEADRWKIFSTSWPPPRRT